MAESALRPVVIVIDDEPLIRQLLRDTLEEAGFEVVEAANDREALAAIATERPDGLAGLVTDVNLGKSASGWEIAQKARERDPGLPIVYVTGDSGHEWASQGVPHSVVIAKPFAPAQIVVALASLVNRSDTAGPAG